ncbi:threonine synthase [Oxobacter pfennigii]|uniref:Threonine synthase n=1 Tax=Oxobacter pfennigii TaxID=36849 RepID=A0A0P8WMS9_9CLOT|nr:threonine synthase [Oxobacter pfennigii]KPU43829.1 threonine synthase [Oxobacter pfennigii]
MEQVFYNSTRGSIKNISSSQAIIKGIAEDGGLLVPEKFPYVKDMLVKMKKMDYKELAYFIMSRYLTDFEESELKACIKGAYGSKFDSQDVAPVKKVGETYFLELFHGPTLAFKDMALSILPYLLKTAVKKQNINKEVVILTATSGDTGKAALEGFSDVEGTSIIVFFPEDGVSEIQKRQMTAHKGKNTHVVGVLGNFDDTQNGVKEIFTDNEYSELLDKKGYMFSSANSINIGRLIPQVVYYFHAYLNILSEDEIAKDEKVNFVVPTGNFGNILAAYYAKEMGLPINKLICASNDNKVLYDFMGSGRYDRTRQFFTTISPSMDILISSNLERLLFEISGKDSEKIKELMALLKDKGVYDITSEMKEKLYDFYGGYAKEEETKNTIRKIFKTKGYLMDTHTAVAYNVYEKYLEETKDDTKTVIVSTASPYKFTSSVMTSIDEKYAQFSDFKLMDEMSKLSGLDIPQPIKDIETRPVIHKTTCPRDKMKDVVSDILNI